MTAPATGGDADPVLVIGFPAVGDFVRCHTMLRLLKAQSPGRPIDLVARAPSVELAAFMPEVREGIAERFRHGRLDLAARIALARHLGGRGYRTVYVLQNAFKAALVPFLARIPERIGWSAEFRFGLINRPRFGRRAVPRMVDTVSLLALPPGHAVPEEWPVPHLVVPEAVLPQVAALRAGAPAGRPIVALAAGSSNPEKNWPIERFAALAAHCRERGFTVWVVGALWERGLCASIRAAVPEAADMTQPSLTGLALALAAADVFVGNDSGPLHIAAALGRPSVGIFVQTQPHLFAPINPGVRAVEAPRTTAQPRRGGVHPPPVEAVAAALDAAVRDAAAE